MPVWLHVLASKYAITKPSLFSGIALTAKCHLLK